MMAHLYEDWGAYDITLAELIRCPDCLIRLVGVLTRFAAADHTAMLLDNELMTDDQITWVANHQEDLTARREAGDHIAYLMDLLMALKSSCDEAGLP